MVIGTIAVGKSPIAVAVDPDLRSVYIVNQADETVSMFNLTNPSQIISIPVGSLPSSVAIDSNTGNVYVSNQADDTISVIDGYSQKPVKTISMAAGKFPTGIAIDVYETGNVTKSKLYVADRKDDTLAEIDILPDCISNKRKDCKIDYIPVGKSPTSLAIDPATHEVYINSD